jgi:hypothetical protein
MFGKIDDLMSMIGKFRDQTVVGDANWKEILTKILPGISSILTLGY